MKVLRVVNESTAGDFAYGFQDKSGEERKALVYDFGGGTFDCTSLIHNKLAGINNIM